MSRQLLTSAYAEIARATHRSYRIKLEALDDDSLRELLRLLRDLDWEKRAAMRRAQLMPWRR